MAVDFARIDLNLLVSLDVLLAERNVTRAAQRLAISQPALSAQLARLREVFGDPLLVPSARGMVPTARARTLAAPLRAALAGLKAAVLEQAAFAPAAAELTLRVAAPDYAQVTLLAPMRQRLQREAPGVRMAWVALDVDTLERRLEEGLIDLALTVPAWTPASAKSRPLLDDRFVCAMRRRHPLAGMRLTLESYCRQEHVLVSPQREGFVGTVDEALARTKRSRRVALSVPHFLVVPPVLAQSNLLATLPERFARQFSTQLALSELPFKLPPLTLQAAWHTQNHRDPAHQWFRELLVDAAVAAAAAVH
ncbi:MAG TPA: LysR family transcriptional regulator [Albitalea sp.]|nr:LysR family transcriptional regulator [Albitalea sp.]